MNTMPEQDIIAMIDNVKELIEMQRRNREAMHKLELDFLRFAFLFIVIILGSMLLIGSLDYFFHGWIQ